MRHLRCALLTAVVVAFTASSAVASPAGGAAVVAPSNGHVLAEWAEFFVEEPFATNPLWGIGEDPCVEFGPGGKLLSAISFGEVTCTAELGTVLHTGIVHFCSTFDPIDSPFYAVGRQDQRNCARAVSSETAGSVTVDGHTVDIFKPQFTAFSPQITVQLPADNVWGVEAQTATITAFGWVAHVRNLRVGRHLITTEVSFEDGATYQFDHVINIVPRR